MTSKPNIILSSLDLQRLQALLDSLPITAFPGKADLQAELDRADVVEPKDVPPSVVRIGTMQPGVEGAEAWTFAPRSSLWSRSR